MGRVVGLVAFYLSLSISSFEGSPFLSFFLSFFYSFRAPPNPLREAFPNKNPVAPLPLPARAVLVPETGTPLE
jgi:hypothetical protein